VVDGKVNSFLIPNVSKLPKHKEIDATEQLTQNSGEFQSLLKDKISDSKGTQKNLPELLPEVNNHQGIKLSIHAQKRLQERNLEMDGAEFFKVKDGIQKLRNKGGQDSLIITKNAAYIVDVKNNTIVTAIDKGSIGENVFTKIDSTIVIN